MRCVLDQTLVLLASVRDAPVFQNKVTVQGPFVTFINKTDALVHGV